MKFNGAIFLTATLAAAVPMASAMGDDVAVTPKVGFWSHQDRMTVEDVQVQVKGTALKITLKTSCLGSPGASWIPVIKTWHVSEHLETRTHDDKGRWRPTDEILAAVITITPIVDEEHTKTYTEGPRVYTQTITYPVEATTMGSGFYIVRAGKHMATAKIHFPTFK